ncbi:MAG: ATP-binding protein [Gemmatimonadota bacterium]
MSDAERERPEPASPIGRVVATERRPNTPHEFHFWTALDSAVGIGTIVRVEGTLPVAGTIPVIYGVVTEGEGYTDLASPLHDVLGAEADPMLAHSGRTARTEVRLYTAAVLRHVPDEPLQPVPMGAVFLGTDRDVEVALRMDSFLRPESSTGIPVGVYRAGGTESPIWVDADFLLGPESAHLNITGVSGLATKTSAVEWLLSSIFAHFPASKGSIAAVCFNVKGPDLCFLDQPAELSPEDLSIYRKLDVPATPFANVRYFAPLTASGAALNTLRSNEQLQDNVFPLTWGLPEVLQYAEVLLNRDDVDAKAGALIDFIAQRIAGQRFDDPALGTQTYRVQSFADLDQWFRDVINHLEARNSESWRTHHIATLRKVRNRLSNIATRCQGLVTSDGRASDLPFGGFADRTVYVIDLANVEEDAQDLVFARVVSKLREHLERRNLGVDHVVVFVDELNKYAPADGQDTYVRKMLLDIAERGRYLGLVLFSAQQFRSQVHRRVVGNSATALYGRMDSDELATPGYSVFSPAIKTRMATMDKGQLMIRHPHFAQPVFVRFPRPAVLTGRDGSRLFPPAPEVSFEDAVLRSLRRVDPALEPGAIEHVFALYDEREIIRARDATLVARPRDVRRFFLEQFARRIPVEPLVTHEARKALRVTPPGDPYA